VQQCVGRWGRYEYHHSLAQAPSAAGTDDDTAAAAVDNGAAEDGVHVVLHRTQCSCTRYAITPAKEANPLALHYTVVSGSGLSY
jgi:hypothetical protein